jgi:transposase
MQKQDTVRSKTEIENRRQQVSDKYLRGMPQMQIADELGVNQATISRDLAELRKEWLERSINHIDQKKAIELAKLDRLEVTFWEAWELSLKDVETITEEVGGKYGPKTTTRREGQSGNPAFLEGVLKCINKRCELLGLDAPKRTELTGARGEPLKVHLEYVTRNYDQAAGLPPGPTDDPAPISQV